MEDKVSALFAFSGKNRLKLADLRVTRVILIHLEETDAFHIETPTYSPAAFLADIGGAAGLIFGLNIVEIGFKN